MFSIDVADTSVLYAYKADSGNDSVTPRLNKYDWSARARLHALRDGRGKKRGRGERKKGSALLF